MFINKDIPENDKIILNKLGKNADMPVSELLAYTNYKRKSSVYNRIRKLREDEYLFGPYFDVNYNAIGTNKLFSIFVFAEYDPLFKNAVLEAMKKIDCWTMIYPVRTAEIYLGVYRCNNWNYIASLFNLLNKWGWLNEYSVHKSENRWITQNPNFFGDFVPPPQYQICKEELLPYSYRNLEPDVDFTETDLTVLKYLSRKTIHLTEIRDLEYHYFSKKLKYHDIKRSYQKLRSAGILLRKDFLIYPLPVNMCSPFFLLTGGKHFESHLQMITSFGKELRLAKKLIVVGKKVISYFITHPLIEGRILGILENVAAPEIDVSDAKIYGIKTYPSTELFSKTFNDDYFDVDHQRWFFPYSEIKEEIQLLKEKKE